MRQSVYLCLGLAVLLALLPNPDDFLDNEDIRQKKSTAYLDRDLEIVSKEEVTVLIVGGGPIGLSLGLLLARQNVHSIIVEKRTTPVTVPAAHQLNIRSNEILQKDGGVSASALKAYATPEEDYRWVVFRPTLKHQTWARFNHVGFLHEETSRNVSWAPYLNIPQSGTEAALLETIEQLPEHYRAFIDLRFGHGLTRCDYRSNQCTIALNGGLSSTAYNVKYKYAVDATGAAGVLRRSSGIRMKGPKGINHVINVLVNIDLNKLFPPKERPLMNWVYSYPSPGITIHSNHSSRMNVQIPYFPPYEGVADFTPSRIRRLIEGIIGDSAIPYDVVDVSFWRMDSQVAESYIAESENVFLVGDSAHRFPPTGGLGMNTGIGDAHALAWRIGMVEKGHAKPGILKHYEIERKEVARRNAAVSYINYLRMEEIFKFLGVYSSTGKLLAALKHKLWFLPLQWRNAAKDFLVSVGMDALRKNMESKSKQEKLDFYLQMQRAHFNSYGLDLGYCYSWGNETDSTERKSFMQNNWQTDSEPGLDISKPMPEWMYHVEQSTEVGCRLPHIFLENASGGTNAWDYSVHRVLNYTQFTLISKIESRQGKVLQQQFSGLLNYVMLDPNIPFPDFQDDTFLLVRPDAHILWKGNDPLDKVPIMLGKLLGNF